MTPREFLLRLRAWLRRPQLDDQLTAEMEHHLELLARDLEHADGMSPDDARAEARRRLGNTTALRESSRDAWGFPGLDSFLQDLRYAMRGLTHAPAFTLTVTLTLGLGIGANAAMFAVIDRLMLRPFPHLKDPDAVNRVYLQATSSGRRNTWSSMPYQRFLDLRDRTTVFSQYAAVSEWRLAVGEGPDTRVCKVAGVSASFFEFFDARPVRGRFFTASEDVMPGGTPVAVLSHAYWQSAFAGRDVAGERLRVGSFAYSIIGVAPADFVGTVQGLPPEIFVPVSTIPANVGPGNTITDYSWDWVDLLVRRKPGTGDAAATADLTNAYRKSRAAQRAVNPRVLPDSIAHPRAVAGAVRDAAGPDPGLESRVLLWVAGVAVIVLVIACANVANLLFARVLRRQREIAVRLALGVSRRRLAGQFITEAMILAAIGLVAGLVFAQCGGSVIRTLLLPEGSRFDLATDWRTLGVASAAAIASALLAVLGPAIAASRADVGHALKSGARAGTFHRSRMRSVLLVLQGALSVVLLVGAGLFVRSLRNVLAIPLGWDASHVVEVYPDFRGQQFDSAGEDLVRRRLLERAQSIPGAEAAARVNTTLFRTNTMFLRVPGIDSVEALGRFNSHVVSPEYFAVMRTRLLRGRGFADSDDRRSPRVAVVSAAMARALWPGRDALGECLYVSWRGAPDQVPCTMIVGIAEDVATQGITDEARLTYYLSVNQLGSGWASRMLIRLRERPSPASVERVRATMQAAMPGDGFVIVRELQEVVDDQRRSWQLGSTLFVSFGGLALVVAAVGLYGVIGYTVAQRMPELGMRVALGARAPHLLGLVLRQGVGFAGTGVAIGLALALVAGRWLEPLLYKQSPRDPVVFAVVCIVMIAVGLMASLGPALRAVRADPNRSLRAE